MSKMAAFTLCWVLFLSSPAYSAGALADAGNRSSERSCDHTRELEAAKRALATGDREGALEHLLRADEILAACQQDPPSAGPGTEPEERMLARCLEREAFSLQAPADSSV